MNQHEAIVRKAYSTAEVKDVRGFVELFTPDGVVRDKSVGVEYVGDNVGGIITVTHWLS